MSNYKNFFKILGLGVVVMLLTCWNAKFQGAAPYWSEGIAFFALAWFTARDEEKKQGLSATWIATALIIGRLLPELPVRIFDFVGSIGSLMVTFNCILAILMGLVCYYGKRDSLYVLSIIIEILISTFVEESWLQIFIK